MHIGCDGCSLMIHKSIEDNILDNEVVGANLTAKTLGGELNEAPTVLAFLRHFG